MSQIHLFNPENDINLAYGHSTPRLSPMVKALIHDGEALPLWYAEPGDSVLAPDVDFNQLALTKEEFALDIATVKHPDDGLTPSPWGWSIATAQRLRALGLTTPDDSRIDRIRELSHRRATIFLANRLGVEPPVEARSIDEVKEQMALRGEVYIKSPWSSSGRGVIKTSRLSERDTTAITAALKRQGSVMVERSYDKAVDFAMLFHADAGKTTMKGYSLFATAADGAYTGNFVGSDEDIIAQLEAKGADRGHLNEIATTLADALTDYVGADYDGWMGVDMIVTKHGEIVPCVELNLRMTMGVVAWQFARKHMAPGRRGFFAVAPLSRDIDNRYSVREGRLESGTLHLCPATPTTRFDFYVSVER